MKGKIIEKGFDTIGFGKILCGHIMHAAKVKLLNPLNKKPS
jgi:hypothetical protein